MSHWRDDNPIIPAMISYQPIISWNIIPISTVCRTIKLLKYLSFKGGTILSSFQVSLDLIVENEIVFYCWFDETKVVIGVSIPSINISISLVMVVVAQSMQVNNPNSIWFGIGSKQQEKEEKVNKEGCSG